MYVKLRSRKLFFFRILQVQLVLCELLCVQLGYELVTFLIVTNQQMIIELDIQFLDNIPPILLLQSSPLSIMLYAV